MDLTGSNGTAPQNSPGRAISGYLQGSPTSRLNEVVALLSRGPDIGAPSRQPQGQVQALVQAQLTVPNMALGATSYAAPASASASASASAPAPALTSSGRPSRNRNTSVLDQLQLQWKRAWTEPEDEKLREFVNIFGTSRWAVIAEYLADRSGKQCRERWHNHLAPAIKKGSWSAEEDAIICTLQMRYGNQWSKITKRLNGRTDNSVKNRYHVLQRAFKSGKSQGMGNMNLYAGMGDMLGDSDVGEDDGGEAEGGSDDDGMRSTAFKYAAQPVPIANQSHNPQNPLAMLEQALGIHLVNNISASSEAVSPAGARKTDGAAQKRPRTSSNLPQWADSDPVDRVQDSVPSSSVRDHTGKSMYIFPHPDGVISNSSYQPVPSQQLLYPFGQRQQLQHSRASPQLQQQQRQVMLSQNQPSYSPPHSTQSDAIAPSGYVQQQQQQQHPGSHPFAPPVTVTRPKNSANTAHTETADDILGPDVIYHSPLMNFNSADGSSDMGSLRGSLSTASASVKKETESASSSIKSYTSYDSGFGMDESTHSSKWGDGSIDPNNWEGRARSRTNSKGIGDDVSDTNNNSSILSNSTRSNGPNWGFERSSTASTKSSKESGYMDMEGDGNNKIPIYNEFGMVIGSRGEEEEDDEVESFPSQYGGHIHGPHGNIHRQSPEPPHMQFSSSLNQLSAIASFNHNAGMRFDGEAGAFLPHDTTNAAGDASGPCANAFSGSSSYAVNSTADANASPQKNHTFIGRVANIFRGKKN